jgi:uncharacterized protein YwqG
MASNEQIMALVQENGLSRVEETLVALMRPSVRLLATPDPEETMPIGVSKIGGRPDLPPMLSWPRWQGLALGFLAQIRLEEVAEADVEGALPPVGMLYFFYEAKDQPWGYDPKDRGKWRVLYGEGDYRRTAPPEDLPEESEFPACALNFRTEGTLPPEESGAIAALGLSKEEQYAYFDVLDGLGEIYTADHDYASHRLLGHPEAIQGDMQLQCQLVSHGVSTGDMDWLTHPRLQSLREGASDWRLLLQLGSDDEAGDFLWADDGKLYFWIREADLQAGIFEDVWVVLQSGDTG